MRHLTFKIKFKTAYFENSEKFDVFSKPLTCSSKLADEARSKNALINAANLNIAIIKRKKIIVGLKQKALWGFY